MYVTDFSESVEVSDLVQNNTEALVNVGHLTSLKVHRSR